MISERQRVIRGAWLEVTLAAPGSETGADELAGVLFEAGSTGLEERAPFPDGRAQLVAYFPAARLPLDAWPIAALGGTVRGTRLLPDRDWEAEWRRGLAPIPLGERLVVVPTRTEEGAAPEIPEGRRAIRLDPGSAFGTGIHPSTQLAAAALERALDARLSAGGPRPTVLDVGTGSGILAIAAALLGAARPVRGIDNDPEAVAEAARNVERNGCADLVALSGEPLARIADAFSVVVANLDAPTLAALASALVARVDPGGALVVAGLREGESWPSPAGLSLVESTSRADWRCERWRRER